MSNIENTTRLPSGEIDGSPRYSKELVLLSIVSCEIMFPYLFTRKISILKNKSRIGPKSLPKVTFYLSLAKKTSEKITINASAVSLLLKSKNLKFAKKISQTILKSVYHPLKSKIKKLIFKN